MRSVIIFLCAIGTTLADQTNSVAATDHAQKTTILKDFSDSDEDVTGKISVTEPTINKPDEEDPISEPTTNQLEKNAIAGMEEVLVAYDATFKQCAPWTDFHQQLENHNRNKRAYTSRSGELAGQIMESLLSVDTQYFQATQAFYGWCGETVPLLEGYETLVDGRDRTNIDGQKELLLVILETDIEKSNIALDRLKLMFSTLNTASDKLDTLVLQLHDDFAEGSQFLKDEIKAAELSANNDLSTEQIVKEILKRSISSLSKLVPEASLLLPLLVDIDPAKPTDAAAKLKAEFADIYTFCKNLWTKLNEGASMDFDPIENDLKSKIQAITSLKNQITSNGLQRQRRIKPIKSAIDILKGRCRTYRSTYGKAAN